MKQLSASGREIAKVVCVSEATVRRILQSASGKFLETGRDTARALLLEILWLLVKRLLAEAWSCCGAVEADEPYL